MIAMPALVVYVLVTALEAVLLPRWRSLDSCGGLVGGFDFSATRTMSRQYRSSRGCQERTTRTCTPCLPRRACHSNLAFRMTASQTATLQVQRTCRDAGRLRLYE